MFSQSVYSVNENTGLVNPTLVLSNNSSLTDIIVKVKDTENRATSEQINVIIKYVTIQF